MITPRHPERSEESEASTWLNPMNTAVRVSAVCNPVRIAMFVGRCDGRGTRTNARN